MNGIKKSKKINLLSSQKLGSQNKKRSLKKRKKVFVNNYELTNFFNFFVFLNKAFFKIFLFFKQKPRLSYFLSIFIITFIVLKVFFYFVENYSETILPSHIQIHTDNKKITNQLYSEVNKELIRSKINNESRTSFLEKINNILNSQDIIDRYWIRLGLDGKLQINAVMQIPALVIESKYNERYVVSSNMHIISKAQNPNEFITLLRVFAPEMKITWLPKSAYLKTLKNKQTQVNAGQNPKITGPINFSWLFKQALKINSEILNLGKGYSLTKVSWTSDQGFVLNINRNMQLIKITQVPKKIESKKVNSLSDPNTKEINTFITLLGDDQITDKLKRLKILLDDLTVKNIFPSEVDLDFNDKATFKIHPSSSTKTL